jgi:hypothetical protein
VETGNKEEGRSWSRKEIFVGRKGRGADEWGDRKKGGPINVLIEGQTGRLVFAVMGV